MTNKQVHSESESGPLVFQMTDITLIESVFGPLTEELPDGLGFKCFFELTHRVNLNSGQVEILVKVNVERGDTDKLVAKIAVGYGYQIQNVQQVLSDDGRIPETKMSVLNSTSISTTRGIFFSLVKGTYLDKVILPVVPVNTLELINERPTLS